MVKFFFTFCITAGIILCLNYLAVPIIANALRFAKSPLWNATTYFIILYFMIWKLYLPKFHNSLKQSRLWFLYYIIRVFSILHGKLYVCMVELNKIYNMDCLEYLKKIPDNFIDLVVTDPPYNVSQKSNINYKNINIVKNFGN